MDKSKVLVFLFFILYQITVHSQNLKVCTYSKYITPTEFISTCGLEKKGQPNIKMSIIDSFLLETDLEKNFILKECEILNTTSAAMIDPYFGYMERYVTFPKNILDNWKKYNSINWRYFGQLMHSIGHQIYRHALIEGVDSQKEELMADEFSGYILAKMGASKIESLTGLKYLTSESQNDQLFPDHASRNQAIKNGWEKFKNGISGKNFLSEKIDLKRLRPLRELTTKNRVLMFNSAQNAMQRREFDNALFNYLELLKDGINFLDEFRQQRIFNHLGHIYFERDNMVKASEYFKIAIKLDPTDRASLLGELKNLRKRGDIEKSISLLKMIIKTTPKNAGLFKELADAYLLTGDVNRAIIAYHRALIFEPKLVAARINLAKTYINEGNELALKMRKLNRYDKERKEYNKMRKLNEGLHQKATEVLEQGLVTNPESRILKKYLFDFYISIGKQKNAKRLKKLME